MRLIDADALTQALHKADTVMGQPHFLCRTVYECINNAPIVDAVPVVRCKDCQFADGWYYAATGKRFAHCIENDKDGCTDNDFCSFGERKEDE